MTKHFSGIVLIVVLFASHLFADGDRDKSPGQNDSDRLQGTWELVSAQKSGADVTKKNKDEGFIIEFKGDSWVQDLKGWHFNTAANSHIKLDPSTSPKKFDHIVILTLQGQTYTFDYPGIYDLNGDSLKLCFDVDLKKRPTEFATSSNDGYFMATLKRIQKEDSSSKPSNKWRINCEVR